MKTVKPEPIRNHRGRMDFKIEAVRTDDKTQMVYCAIVPEPRRYTTIEVDGEKYFLDKYLRHLISAEEMQRGIVQQMAGLPVFSLSPSIDSTPDMLPDGVQQSFPISVLVNIHHLWNKHCHTGN